LQTKANPARFLTVGTRGSPLARAQADEVRRLLAGAHSVAESDIVIEPISTRGDRATDRPISEAGGKGLFTKEIEQALLDGIIDIAVHSTKDLATILPPGLALAVCPKRADVRDAWVANGAVALADLPAGARIGTSSIRRAAQMLRARPDCAIVPMRGNVGTRLKKLAEGAADATVLAAAGLDRLGESAAATALLDPEEFLPAPCQGAICVQIRSDDRRAADLLAPLADTRTTLELTAERAFLAGLDGSCRVPVGALTQWLDDKLRLTGELIGPDGKQHFRAALEGPPAQAVMLGQELAGILRAEAGEAFFADLEGRPQ
jgi:hydroxymethylbilane synthase